MTYIINPMWFYWISVIDKVGVTLQVVSFLSGITLAGCIFLAIITDYDEIKKNLIFIIKLVVPVFVISILGIILIPTSDVLIVMQVAKFATVENAQWTLDAIKSAVDYIIQAIGQM